MSELKTRIVIPVSAATYEELLKFSVEHELGLQKFRVLDNGSKEPRLHLGGFCLVPKQA